MLEEYNYDKHECCKKEKGKSRCCIDLIIFILSVALAFTIGLIVGALTSIIVLVALPAVIVLAVILALLLILRIIMLICCSKKC